MNRKRILIPNGNPSEFQLINAAHRLGLFVITSGNNANAPAHPFADRYVYADFSDRQALLDVAIREKVDYICSNSNDIALVSTVWVCEQLGLPGHDSFDTTLRLHHKDRFKALAKDLGLHIPEGHAFSDQKQALEYAFSQSQKVIIKPTDLVGGNGVSEAETPEEKSAAIDKAFALSLSKKIIIEEYIEGTAHSLSCFIVDGKVVLYFCDNEYTFGKPYKVSTSASPATNFKNVRDKLIGDVEKVARALKLRDGRLHVQYLMKDGKPYILEMCRRISGDMYSVPESYSLGFNIADWYLKAECGMDVSGIPRVKQTGMYGRHCITASRKGVTNGICIDERLDACILQRWLWNAYGHTVTNCENDILGLLFFKFESVDQREYAFEHLADFIVVNIIE